jgi:predicted RNA-binding Zn ribbon-like protein
MTEPDTVKDGNCPSNCCGSAVRLHLKLLADDQGQNLKICQQAHMIFRDESDGHCDGHSANSRTTLQTEELLCKP